MLRYLITILCLWCLHSGHAQPAGCDMKRNSGGVKVYTCKTENEKLKLLIAEFELINVSIAELQKFLWDVKNYTSWQYNMIEAEKLADISPDEMHYRSLVDAPWPVDDRELIVDFKAVKEPNGMKIFVKNISGKNPPAKDVVRIPMFDATWVVKAEGKNLKVTYRLKVDPGGAVPAWMANMAMAEGPHLSYTRLKAQLDK